jgi:hypothetical protein
MQSEGLDVKWTLPEHNLIGIKGDRDDIADFMEDNPKTTVAMIDIGSVKKIASGELRLR